MHYLRQYPEGCTRMMYVNYHLYNYSINIFIFPTIFVISKLIWFPCILPNFCQSSWALFNAF